MTPAFALNSYRRWLATMFGQGELVTLVRQGDTNVYQAHGWVTDFIPSDLAGAVEQGRRSAVLLAADVVASQFPLPFRPKQDRLVWNSGSTSNAITKVDDATRRIGTTLIAYELDLEGA